MTLAGGILQGLGQARLQEGSDDVPLAAARTAVSVEAREAPDLSDALATRDEAVQALARVTRGDPRFSSLYAKARTADETYRLAAFGPGPIGAEVQALRLGDVAVVTFPGELFCRLGLRLKEQSPAAMTMLATCANGCLGYLHPLEAWEHGGYEVGPGAWCRVAPGQPERLVEAAQALLRGLF